MRSSRKRNKVNYVQPEEGDSDDDLFEVATPNTQDSVGESNVDGGVTLVIDKLLGRKLIADEEDPSIINELFLVKWRGMSYLHVSWEMRDDLERVDPQGKMKIRRFFQTPQPPAILGEAVAEEDEIEYFSPDLVEIQRIISCNVNYEPHSSCETAADLQALATEPTNEEIRYLVKWTGLPYNEASWELWDDIKHDSYEVWRFWKRQRPPSRSEINTPHPSIQDYQRLATSPLFGDISEDGSGLELRDYQLEGVNWLLWNWWHKRPCILADEMGLGKTIQSVCFLHQLRHMPATRCAGPFLLVAPLSLINQWQNEITLWSPDMNCVVVHGNSEAREIVQQFEYFYQEPFTPRPEVATLKRNNVTKFNILLTTYEIAMKDIKALQRIQWKVMIVDEAHRLKNQQSKLFEMLSLVPREHCVLLTGTPLQNKTEELWALLNFADKSKFNDLNEFVKQFGDLRDANDVARLHAVLKPFLLRRVKEDVEKSLPPKEETIIEVTLTALQKQFYRAIYEKNTAFLFRGTKANNQPSLMNVMMELRKCCNHPYLIKGVEDRVLSEIPPEQRTHDVLHGKMVDCAGKFVLLDKLLPRLYQEGHKVLIFSQMVKALNMLEEFLRHKGYLYERLDGSTRSTERIAAVERFSRPSLQRFVMLLSTKAGGLGLNLTAADTVIIFDSDWNPHNDMQAQARAHRIGQKRAVMVYRLLTRKTYEMHMFHKASMKLGLDRAVLACARNDADGDEDAGDTRSGMQAKEIDELLKRGAYDVFREDDTEQNEFVEADIDAIMKLRAHKVSYENITENSLSSSLGGFSKASFVAANETEDVDINDPDFWKKAIGFEEPPAVGELEIMIENLPQQRKRKQTQLYDGGNQANQAELDELLEEIKEKKQSDSKDSREKKTGEAKPPKEPKDTKTWGPHSRDRLVRSLLQYGFGRWSRIRKEAGASQREIKDIEAFARGYMFQCGLSASEQEPSKNDSEFITDAINGAKTVDAMVKSGVKTLDTPAVLTDEKFLSRLKGGAARKTLHKLEMLSKLLALVSRAVEAAYAANPDVEKFSDIDSSVMALTPGTVSKYLPLGDLRPSWTRPRSWWDDDCDRHLLMGVFVYGYGRYMEIKDDPQFVFLGKIRDWTSNARASLMKSQDTANTDTAVGDKLVPPQEDIIISHFHIDDGRECRLLLPTSRLSDYLGVYSQPGSVKWMAQYGDDVSSTYMGSFDSEELAASAYDEAARKVEGENALVNFDENGNRVHHDIDRDHRPGLPWHRASKYRGVRASGAKWTAQISYDGGNHHLGTFCCEIEAAVAYDSAAKDHHGPTAISNFPNGVEAELLAMSYERGVVVEFLKDGTCERYQNGELISADAAEQMELSKSAVEEAEPVLKFRDPSPLVPSEDTVDTRNDNVSLKFSEAQEGSVLDTDMGDDDSINGDKDGEEELLGEAIEEGTDKKKDKEVDVGMPDARVLNRLFCWLVSAEAAKSAKDAPDTKPRKRQRKEEAAEKKEVKARMQAKEERKYYQQLGEVGILTQCGELLEKDNSFLSSKKALLRRCENLLRRPMEGDTGELMDTEVAEPVCVMTTEPSPEEYKIPFSEEIVRRICSALLLYGAPIDDEEKIHSSILSHVGTLPQSATLREYNWEQLLTYAGVGVEVAVDEMCQFYTNAWVPFSACLLKQETFTNKVLLPSPLHTPSEHSASSKSLCYAFFMRQKSLRAIRYLLSKQFSALMEYLQSPSGRNVSDVPVWWCPWIHDVALLIGCYKHGFLALEEICMDVELPFYLPTLKKFIRRVFLFGVEGALPAAHTIFDNVNDAEKWVHMVSLVFPDQKHLESRIMRILSDMTQTLPASNPCRVLPELVEPNDKCELKFTRPLVDIHGVRPVVPLAQFLADSAQRRRLAVSEHHPNIIE